jgi:hypothetical protein
MKMKLTVMAMAAALGYSGLALAMSKEERKAEESRIDIDYKAAKTRCDGLKGNAKDVCTAQADGAQKVAKAELEARDKGTIKAQNEARIAKAEAAYAVAKERCDDAAGNVKDVCVADAKVILARANADAKVDREAREADVRVADARQAASRHAAKAGYHAARERCDRFAGDVRDRCINDAKAQFGQ